MALKTFVKISEVNNLSDARYCAGMGVDLMGFCLDPTNELSLSPEKFSEITGWISGVKLVGEFYESSTVVIKELIDSYAIHFIQTNKAEELEYLSTLNIPIMLNIDVSLLEKTDYLEETIKENAVKVAYFVLTASGADADSVEFERYLSDITVLSKDYPIILGFGISADNVESIINSLSIAGIELQGGDEIKPGFKDFGELADILEALEIDD